MPTTPPPPAGRAIPEQCDEKYDAFLDGQQVGSLRLWPGHFRVDVPDVGWQCVYAADDIDSDRDIPDAERPRYLQAAVEAIAAALGLATGEAVTYALSH